MTIDQMMAEIRETHPGMNLTLYGHRNRYRVTDMAGVLFGESCSKYEAVYSALKAVRKARPKPMTVVEAKAAVRSKRGNLFFLEPLNGMKRLAFQHGRKGIVLLGEGPTEGQAWKAAAAAIRESEEKG